MPRREKNPEIQSRDLGFTHKFIPIFFNQEEKNSPYVLDLPQKLTPPSSAPWQPTQLDKILSNPLAEIDKIKIPEKFSPTPKIKLDFKPFAESRWQKIKDELSFSWPHFSAPALKIQPKKAKLILPIASSPVKLKNSKTSKNYKAYFPLVLPNWQKAALSFTAMALLFVLPVKAFSAYYQLRDSQENIITAGTEAFQDLKDGETALQNGNLPEAASKLQSALDSFALAQNKLNEINPVWRSLLYLTPKIGNKLKNGEELMLAGTNLTMGSLPILYLLNNKNNSPISLQNIKETLDKIAPRFAKTKQNLMAIDPDFLPEENQTAFLKIREAIFALNNDLQKISSLSNSLLAAAGTNTEKTYLLIFQNNNEIRPTGGFIGSFAEIKIKNGQIVKLDIPSQGSYALQGNQVAEVLPPIPLQLLQPRWEFRDANWFPDFPTSAKKLMWFYEKSGGPTVDGVIALDTVPFIDLIKIIGAIEMPKYNLTINPNNVIETVQQQVEMDYDKEKNAPKEILGDLAPLILEKLFSDKNNLLPLLSSINKNLAQKHIQFYFTNPVLEKEILAQNWGGEIKTGTGDYLAVISANIGGDKSDKVIEQQVNHQSQILEDGSIIDTVTITRKHPGSESFFSQSKNNDYLRFYVPAGSQLLSAEGFNWPDESTYRIPEKWYKLDEDLQKIEQNKTVDIKTGTITTQEFGKTVFANWLVIKPLETVTAKIIYLLPFKVKVPTTQKNLGTVLANFFKQNKNYSSYSLLVQKQAGTNFDAFSTKIEWPKEWNILWTNQEVSTEGNQAVLSTNLIEDNFLGLVFEN
ncbi:MAG: hypothetical protein UT86_C0002G0130 [Candidatus Magasanikbacteria bacterium GW2011_GWC2_40_17]|uniref:DUF4012 domain-containing protein n=1 Tax=Candidatus Magasanikbacteria bacterium GW2011_GWA2_42_32 TaxID=1619039 RepID=A0A0G1CFD7_9BACT|nr:MAG: hypothetical protein UT86_C0002G0130 [Candidatus Magasanikbacteria bacterium GW2011_GWC2_40_17]KKS57291.1 MAG: hypothetical protein UV20_C0002G0080 [Candidatus Magasanikbacteria bacterium GW2011_GWA2_42_32]OGH86177.1 MAG: hypothetical protein A2294_02915 [Candidatus Magasanikbacteria bacterium RIFOXYB2_FULL_38_10]